MPGILHMLDVNAAPSAVYDLVATTAGVGRWWSTEVDGGDAVGDRVTVRFGGEWRVVMERTELAPNERVGYRIVEHDSDEWPGTELVFALAPDEDWTQLRFDHLGWRSDGDFFRFCSAKWVVFLQSIKRAAEQGAGTPYPDEPKIGRRD